MSIDYKRSSLLLFALIYLYHNAAADPRIVQYNALNNKKLSPKDYAKQVRDFWSKEKMEQAKPIEHFKPFLSRFNQKTNRTFKQENDEGKPFKVEGRLPDPSLFDGRSFALAERTMYTVGKIFIQVPVGYATCSGAVVTAPTESLVVTAAHCMYDLATASWMVSNWIFVPLYDDNTAPLGMWTGYNFVVLTGWSASTSASPGWNYDVGFAVIAPLINMNIELVTGSLGIGFNLPNGLPLMTFGYPANIANAQIMSSCYGKGLVEKCGVAGYTGQAQRCGMTFGSSGGPRIQNFVHSTGNGYVVSVVSYGCGIDMSHGPGFTSTIKILYDFAKLLR